MTKLMKKSLLTVAIAVILAGSLAFAAFAGNFTHIADDLHDLGLFQGASGDYQLGRAPTRAEALTMLIRLLGLEEAAQGSVYEHPFTDVPNWADRTVAYAFANGLTTGVSATAFGTRNPATAQMYVTFILRALGYSDAAGGDFRFSGAIEFGKSKGVIDDLLASGPFLRDQMVAVSFLALGAAPKDSQFDTLLEKLIDGGAVPAATGAALLERFKMLAEAAAVQAALSEERNIAMSINMEMDMGLLSLLMGGSGGLSIKMDMSMIVEDSDILAAITMAMNMGDDEQSVQMYITDGFVYIDADGEKMKMDAGLADVEGLLAMANLGEIVVNPIYFFTGITRTSEGGFTVYSVELADGFMDSVMGMAAGMMGSAGMGDFDLADLGEVAIEVPSIRYYVSSAGLLRKISMVMSITMRLDIEGVALPVTIGMATEMEITATGDAVRVTLPDNLGEYVLYDPE
jgi:hypothetical protein